MASVADEVSALCRVRSRRLFIEDRRRFDDQVSRLDDRWDYEIAVRRLYANRSQEQNRYYWGVVVDLLCARTDYTPDEMHDVLKMKFIPKKLAVCDGNGVVLEEFVVGGSTRKMTTAQFSEYCEAIQRWAAEFFDPPLYIPDPNEPMPAQPVETHGWGV